MRRPLRFSVIAVLCLAASLALAAPPQPKETANYGVYLLGSRIGSMVTKTFEAMANGKPALRVEAVTTIRLQAFGDVEQTLRLVQLVDGKGSPITSAMTVESKGRSTVINARYHPDRVVCVVDAGGQKSTKTVSIPEGVSLSADPSLGADESAAPPKVGDKRTLHFFEPTTMTIQKVETEVLKAEPRPVGGKEVPAFLVKTSNSITGVSQSWVDAEGRLLEDNNPLGLRIVREDASAPPVYEPPKDFAIATAIETTVKIPEPRKVRRLRLKISGIPEERLLVSDSRQRITEIQKSDAGVTAVYEIRTGAVPQPALPAARPGTVQPELSDAPYLGLTDPTIRKKAQELSAGAATRAAIARRISDWVRGHMREKSNIGTPRGAPEIMRSRDGVCRDYATLFAALARAAGVPTRLCSGIVYFQDRFFYHAWVECQLAAGDAGWLAFDPTMSEPFVDATHVKFAQGDPTDMFAGVRVVGHLRVEVLGFE